MVDQLIPPMIFQTPGCSGCSPPSHAWPPLLRPHPPLAPRRARGAVPHPRAAEGREATDPRSSFMGISWLTMVNSGVFHGLQWFIMEYISNYIWAIWGYLTIQYGDLTKDGGRMK